MANYLLFEATEYGSQCLDINKLLSLHFGLAKPVIWVLTILILIKLEILSPPLDLLCKAFLPLVHILRVGQLQMVGKPNTKSMIS